jgi:hypothetical protein
MPLRFAIYVRYVHKPKQWHGFFHFHSVITQNISIRLSTLHTIKVSGEVLQKRPP